MHSAGFDSPQRAALGDIPDRHSRIRASDVHTDHAFVLLDTGSVLNPYLYGVFCYREGDLWREGSGSNSPGWSLLNEATGLGALAFWDEAPAESDLVRVRFRGRDHEVEAIEGYFLVVFWDVVDPDEWPRVVAHQVRGKWHDRSVGGGRTL